MGAGLPALLAFASFGWLGWRRVHTIPRKRLAAQQMNRWTEREGGKRSSPSNTLEPRIRILALRAFVLRFRACVHDNEQVAERLSNVFCIHACAIGSGRESAGIQLLPAVTVRDRTGLALDH